MTRKRTSIPNAIALRGLMPVMLASVLAFAIGCGKSKAENEDAAAAPVVPVVKVARRNLSNTLEIASELQPFQEINVYAKVSGYIQKLYIDWGTHVKEGQLMAVLEIPELEQQLAQDQASVRRAEEDTERAKEELNRAQSAYSVAHITYTRLADVQKTQPALVAQQDIDVAQGKDQEASASVSAAKAAQSAAEQELAASKAAFDKDKALFAYSRITAPFEGVVTRMDAYTGALLPAGTSANKGDLALCRLSQNDLLRLVIPVPERAVADVHMGQKVDVDVSALNRKFTGTVARFSDQIDFDTRTMHTEVNVPNPKDELIPGMYASVEIPLHAAANALTIPIQAIQPAGNGKATVLAIDPSNRIDRRTVQLGLQTANAVEVLSGLAENDSIILGAQSQYRPGQLVKPKVVEPAGLE
jgi:RND family efflux transporter MFP subunit